MTITYGSLFSGVGGFDLGFDRAGMTCRWQCEIDRDARRVLAHRWPDVPCHEDITALDGAALPPVDVICGGFPCQDISVAGNRVGLVGDRSGLFFEMIRVIREMRDATGGQSPTLAVIENVPFLLRVNRGRDMAVVLGELADSGALDIGWRVLDAQWFGVAQRRRRLFVVADFGGRHPAEILALADSLRGDPPPRRTAGQGAAAGAEGGTGSRRGTYWDGGQLSDTLDVSMLVKGQMMPEKRRFPVVTQPVASQHAVAFDLAQVTSPGNYSNPKPGDPCHPLTGAANQSVVAIGGDVTHALTHEGHDASEDGTGRGTPIIAFTNRGIDSGVTAERLRSDSNGALPMVLAFTCKDSGQDAGDLAPTLRAMPHDGSHANGGGQVAVAFVEGSTNGVGPMQDIHGTLTAVQPSDTSHFQTGVVQGMTVRRLTPRECERLQGFPDVSKTATIIVCLNCSEQPKSDALADNQSPKWRRRASHAEVTVSSHHVWFAEQSSAPKHPSDSRHAAVTVHIDCERNAVAIHSLEKCLWSASGAEPPSSSPLAIPTNDFVRLAAHMTSTAERIIQAGKAALPSVIEPSTPQQNGGVVVLLSGRENTAVANGVADSTTAKNRRSTYTTSEATSSSQSCDSELTTSLCSVLNAISSCIPEPTPGESSFTLSITTKSGWTRLDPPQSDAARYRQLGNAVAVPVAAWLGRQIVAALEGA